MLKLLAVGALVASLVPSTWAGSDSVDDWIQQGFDTYNLLANCYGKEHMDQFVLDLAKHSKACGLDGPAKAAILEAGGKPVLGRRRRQAAGANEIETFLSTYKKYDAQNKEAAAGLVCVLDKFGMLNEDGSINIEAVITSVEESKEEAPKIVETLTTGMRDCYKVSTGWPAEMLERYYGQDPEAIEMARTHIFFQCSKKIEHRMCYIKQAYELQELLYGNMDDVDHAEFGLPADEWEAAYDALRAEVEAGNPAQLLIDEMFWTKPRFL